MVLFTLEHIGGLYQILTFRFIKHKNERAVLLVNEAYKNYAFLRRMQGNIFADILFYKVKFRKEDLKEKNWEEQVYNDYQVIFDKSDYSIKDFSSIYCTHDIFCDFLYYCAKNEVYVNYMEIAKGHLSNENVYTIYTLFFHGDPGHEEFSRKYDTILGAKSVYVKNRYVFSKSLDKDIQTNMIDEFYRIGKEYRRVIANVINSNKSLLDRKSSLFLLNSSGWVVPKAHMDVYAVHAVICDVYLRNENNLYLKDHPGNVCVRNPQQAEKFFYGINSLTAEVPLELIILSTECTFRKVISCSSTSNEKVANFVEENVVLGNEPYTHWHCLLKLLYTYELEKFLEDVYREHFHGIPKGLLVNYRKTIGKPFSEGLPKGINPSILKGKIFTVIDKIENKDEAHIECALKQADDDTVVIFWNTDEAYKFVPLDNALLTNFLILKIAKIPQKNNLYPDMKDEFLYIYVKNVNTREKLKRYVDDRNLKYSKCNIHAEIVHGDNRLELYNERKRRIKAERESVRLEKELQVALSNLDFEQKNAQKLLMEEISNSVIKTEWQLKFYHEMKLYKSVVSLKEGDEGYAYQFTLIKSLNGKSSIDVLEFGCSESTRLVGAHVSQHGGKHTVLEYERGWAEFFFNQNRQILAHTTIYGGGLLQKTGSKGDKSFSFDAINRLESNEKYGLILLKYPRKKHEAPVLDLLTILPQCLDEDFIIIMPVAERASDYEHVENMEDTLKKNKIVYHKITYKTGNYNNICIFCNDKDKYRFYS